MELTAIDTETGMAFMANPMRDIVHFMPQLVDTLDTQLQPKFIHPIDQSKMNAAGITHDILMDAFAKFSLFFVNTLDCDIKSPFDAIIATGFLDTPQVAQDIVLAYFSKVLLGACWVGIRSSTMAGQCPPIISNMKKRAKELITSLNTEVAA